MKLDQIEREYMLRGALYMASRHNKRVPLWSFVASVCQVGSTSGYQICQELGWNPDEMATKELPPYKSR